MNSIDAISILERCIEETKNMTEDEFQKIKNERGIDDNKYLNRLYSQGDIELVLPGTFEYNKILEEENFVNWISIDYNERFKICFEYESQRNMVDYNMANAA